MSTIDELRRLPIRVAVLLNERIVVSSVVPPGADIILGSVPPAICVPGWTAPTLPILTAGEMLNLDDGMTIHMCDDDGSNRVHDTVEHLRSMGVQFPLRVVVSKVNIRIRPGLVVLLHFTAGGRE